MGKLISLLIDRSHQRTMAFLLWLGVFVACAAALLFVSLDRLTSILHSEGNRALAPTIAVWDNVANTSKELLRQVTAEPCSPEFHEQLRRVAFLPDGLNEFIYAPGGVAQCSVNDDFAPYALGQPTFMSDGRAIYFRAPLDFLKLGGQIATIALIGDFGIVVPSAPLPLSTDFWIDQEVFLKFGSGLLHATGTQGLHQQYLGAMRLGPLTFADGKLFVETCANDNVLCITSAANLAALMRVAWPVALMGLAIAALVALGISGPLHGAIRSFWSFEARFRRHFTQESIICTYQPILSIESGQIHGCEVLVRWRDLDGSTVFPDQFLPVIVKHGLSKQLTRFVMRQAYDELAAKVPPTYRLQVNFNIEPSDLDATWLHSILAIFESAADRFSVVIEIVESDQVQIEHAARQIDALRRYGIRTQLDDFGTGYSNIQNLASLPLDGVKLDRSFAMAQDEGLMHRMMFSTIEMVHAAGHRLTVEGVESEERLRQLAATGHVQFAQGYYVARPLDIDRFVQVLAERSAANRRPRLVA